MGNENFAGGELPQIDRILVAIDFFSLRSECGQWTINLSWMTGPVRAANQGLPKEND